MIMNITVPQGGAEIPNNWYQSPVRQKTEVYLGDIRIFKVFKNKF
jgi:hypothetical protein